MTRTGFLRLWGDPHPPTRTPRDTARVAREGVALAARLRMIQLTHHRVVAGMLSGSHQTDRLGAGWDKAEARPYEVGDDVRHIDWFATARTGATQVRPTIAEREVMVAIVVDASRSMMFGTRGLTKYELALALAGAASEIVMRGGNPVALIRVDPSGPRWMPVIGTRAHHDVALRRITEPVSPKTGVDLAEALRQLARVYPRCRRVVVCSDLRAPGIEQPLRALAATRSVVVIEPYDVRERELPPIGEVAMRAEKSYGWLDTDDPEVRERFEKTAKERAEARAALVRSTGATHLAVPTDRDWVDEVAEAMLVAVGRLR